jgi:hypothetical protein
MDKVSYAQICTKYGLFYEKVPISCVEYDEMTFGERLELLEHAMKVRHSELDTSELKQVRVHDMDAGSLAGSISCEGHTMTIEPWWENCGQTGEDLTCSCGFHSQEKHGGGCHMHPIANQEHELDELHRELYDAAQAWLREQPWIEDAAPEQIID